MNKNFFDYLRAGEFPCEVIYDGGKYKTFIVFITTTPYFKSFIDEFTAVEECINFELPQAMACPSALTVADVKTMMKNSDHMDYLLRHLVDKLLRAEDSYESIFAALFDYYYMVRNYNQIPLDTVH